MYFWGKLSELCRDPLLISNGFAYQQVLNGNKRKYWQWMGELLVCRTPELISNCIHSYSSAFFIRCRSPAFATGSAAVINSPERLQIERRGPLPVGRWGGRTDQWRASGFDLHG